MSEQNELSVEQMREALEAKFPTLCIFDPEGYGHTGVGYKENGFTVLLSESYPDRDGAEEAAIRDAFFKHCSPQPSEQTDGDPKCFMCGYPEHEGGCAENAKKIDHEFIWRADHMDCSLCGEPHSGCEIVKLPQPAAPDAERVSDEQIIGNLIQAMRRWAGEEDGIPDFCANSFNAAMLRLGWSYSTYADLSALRAAQPASPARSVLTDEDAIRGLMGLVQLICARPDVPATLMKEITTSHRWIDAQTFLGGK